MASMPAIKYFDTMSSLLFNSLALSILCSGLAERECPKLAIPYRYRSEQRPAHSSKAIEISAQHVGSALGAMIYIQECRTNSVRQDSRVPSILGRQRKPLFISLPLPFYALRTASCDS